MEQIYIRIYIHILTCPGCLTMSFAASKLLFNPLFYLP
jgi:hypothetical protein